MDIVGFSNYEILPDGRVYSKKKMILLKPQNNGNGYLKVHLYVDGKMCQRYIHRLVAEHFLPNPEGYEYVDHLDRNKENNSMENLRWCSASENTNNTASKKRYSVSRAGASHYSAEFKSLVISDYNNGMRVMDISRKYNIPRQSVSSFIKNNS